MYQNEPSQQWLNNDAFANGPYGKSRGVTAIIAFFLGSLGVQYFYVGKSMPGLVFLCVSIFTCGLGATITGTLSLIQTILLLCGNNQDFEAKWVGPTSGSFPLF